MTRALGRYELLRPLARGGMAEVYLARRRAAGVEKWLVVKRMRPERSGDPRFLDLFVREARLSMSLVHQNIVPVFDFGRIDDQVFLAMERVEGRDLGSSLARAPTHRMPTLLAAFVAAECCQALDYAHQRKGPDGVALGVVHRDVTPRNVLLSWSGEVKLTDFGIAALAGEATSRLLGTPQYMAPEQARSEPIDPRADIYAIGLVLREAVSGIRPRPGVDRDAILDAARRGVLLPWPAPSDPLPGPPPDLALGSGDHGPQEPPSRDLPPAELVAIIDRAIANVPDDRYPDARSMLEDLDHYIVGERSRHKADSPARQLAAWLDGLWEGARDEIESDAAIEAEHLVSFLDDGAFDVIGTGTVRSLAATAADDAVGAPGAPELASHAAPLSPPSPTKPASLPPGQAADAVRRSSRISSSNATVASGSIHTIPTRDPDDDHPAMAQAQRGKRRSIATLASILLVGVAAAVTIAITYSGPRDRGAAREPTTGQPIATQPIATQPKAGQLVAGPSAAGQPAAGPSAAGQPSAGHPTTGQPTTGHTGAGRAPLAPTTEGQSLRPDAGRPSSTRRTTERTDADRPAAGRPTEPPSSEPGGSSSGTTGRAPTGGNAARPTTCRVRINLTPWAYYTVDHDTTRHETPGTIDLAPGEHRLHVWNPELHIERDMAINVPADRDTMNFSEPLQPSTTHPDANPLPPP